MVPLPTATSFEDLNQQVLERCLQEDARTVARRNADHWGSVATGTFPPVASPLGLRLL